MWIYFWMLIPFVADIFCWRYLLFLDTLCCRYLMLTEPIPFVPQYLMLPIPYVAKTFCSRYLLWRYLLCKNRVYAHLLSNEQICPSSESGEGVGVTGIWYGSDSHPGQNLTWGFLCSFILYYNQTLHFTELLKILSTQKIHSIEYHFFENFTSLPFLVIEHQS